MSNVYRFFAFLVLLSGVLLSGLALAQGQPASSQHLSVKLLSEQAAVAPGSQANIALQFQMEPHWHIYWVNAGDSGEPPRATWHLPAGASVGSFEWPVPKRFPTGPLTDFGYEGTVLLIAPLQIPAQFSGSELPINATVKWLVCSNICIPGQAEVSLRLPVASTARPDSQTAPLFAEARKQIPASLPAGATVRGSQTQDAFTLDFRPAGKFKTLSFFPLESSQVENSAPQKVQLAGGNLRLSLQKSDQILKEIQNLRGVVVAGSGESYAIDVPLNGKFTSAVMQAPPASFAGSQSSTQSSTQASGSGSPDKPQSSRTGFGTAILLAFLGGIVLNFMPCVFPVLSLKILGFVTAGAEERSRLRRHGLLYTLGILVSFWLLVAALLAIRAAGSHVGWGFQLQSPGFVAALAGLMLLLGLNMAGVFEFGYSLMGVGSSLARKEGNSGAFFTGILATVVATPCTAPFMGTAVGFALSQPATLCVLIFTAIALGLAAPFLLLAYKPSWIGLLPKPGRWMETMKQLFAFPLFATVIWLVWVFGLQTSLDATARLLAMLLILSLAAWVLGRWPARMLATGIAVLIVFGSVAWFSRTNLRAERPAQQSASSTAQWVPYSPASLASYQSQGRPVFVDFTAAWCLTCQVNERAVLRTPEFINKAQQRNVVLMKADWTSYDPTITQALASLGRSAVPLYVIYSSDASQPANVLPEGILTPQTVLQALGAAK